MANMLSSTFGAECNQSMSTTSDSFSSFDDDDRSFFGSDYYLIMHQLALSEP
jgi:hypothetical protein